MAASRGWHLASDDRGRAFRRLVRERIDEKRVFDTVGIANLAKKLGVLSADEVERIHKLTDE